MDLFSLKERNLFIYWYKRIKTVKRVILKNTISYQRNMSSTGNRQFCRKHPSAWDEATQSKSKCCNKRNNQRNSFICDLGTAIGIWIFNDAFISACSWLINRKPEWNETSCRWLWKEGGQGARISNSFPLPNRRSVLGVSVLVLAYRGVHPHPGETDTELCYCSGSGSYQLWTKHIGDHFQDLTVW